MLASSGLCIWDSVKVSKQQVLIPVPRAHGPCLVIALHLPRASGSSGKQPGTPAEGHPMAFSDAQ